MTASIASANTLERLKVEWSARASVPGKAPSPTAATNASASTSSGTVLPVFSTNRAVW